VLAGDLPPSVHPWRSASEIHSQIQARASPWLLRAALPLWRRVFYRTRTIPAAPRSYQRPGPGQVPSEQSEFTTAPYADVFPGGLSGDTAHLAAMQDMLHFLPPYLTSLPTAHKRGRGRHPGAAGYHLPSAPWYKRPRRLIPGPAAALLLPARPIRSLSTSRTNRAFFEIPDGPLHRPEARSRDWCKRNLPLEIAPWANIIETAKGAGLFSTVAHSRGSGRSHRCLESPDRSLGLLRWTSAFAALPPGTVRPRACRTHPSWLASSISMGICRRLQPQRSGGSAQREGWRGHDPDRAARAL